MAVAVARARLAPLYIIAFLSLIDTSFISPVISSYAKSLGASDLEAGIAAAAYSMVAIPASIAMGYVIDLVGRKRILAPLFVGDAVALYMYSLASSYSQLLLAKALHAVFDSGVFPASIAIFRESIEGRRVGRYMGLYWVFISLAIIVGSSTASYMVLRVGFRPVFQLLSALMILGLVASIFSREIYSPPRARGGISFSALKGYWVAIAPAYVSALILYMAIGAITGSLSPNLIKHMGFTETRGAAATGIYMAVATVAALPANMLAGALIDRVGRYRVLAAGGASLAASMAILSASLADWARYASSVLQGVALALILVSSSEIAVSVPGQARGTSSAIYSSMLLLGVVVGSPLAGYLTERGAPEILGHTIYTPFLVPAILSAVLAAASMAYKRG